MGNAYNKPNVISDFLKPGTADPWIVAYALVYGGAVVSQETLKPKGKKISIADVRDRFGIYRVDVFEFLRMENTRFEYEKRGAA